MKKEAADLLFINQHILEESKARQENIAIVCIDYRKVYDTVLQS